MRSNFNRGGEHRFLPWLLCVILLIFCFFISWKTGYAKTILQRIGVIEKQEEIDWAVKSWENTLSKMDYDADIVFFGDSLTYSGDFNKNLEGLKIVNLGYPGDDLDGMILRTEMISDVKPEKIFIMAGINSLIKLDVEDAEIKFENLIDKIKKENPNAILYIESVLPLTREGTETFSCPNAKIEEYNSYVMDYANRNQITYIDLYSEYEDNGFLAEKYCVDGKIHLKSESYGLWYSKLREYVY